MILIYCDESSSRLQYIAAFIFKELLQVQYSITTHKKGFRESAGTKLNYSHQEIMSDELRIPNKGLLFEKGVKPQVIEINFVEGFKCFFKSHPKGEREFPFDIFSASFYLLSRYEEYLPHEKDKYGRYSCANSLAYKENFLHLPLVNIWIDYFKNFLVKNNSDFDRELSKPKSAFQFIPTYDVDTAFAYLHKGPVKNFTGIIGSFVKLKFNKLKERLSVLSGLKKDPFEIFNWLDTIHQTLNLNPIYFFLVSEKNARHDKNILPQRGAMAQLIINHAKTYSIGLHPSWQSGENFSLLQKEKKRLENISGKAISKSRQHYLRFNLPTGYSRLLEAGITGDYSMGYGTNNGFRASVASSFLWYDIEKEQQTNLRIFPFCYMDSNVIFHQKLSIEAAEQELMNYYNVCKKVNGIFIGIFHNHLMGDDNLQWRNLYERFLNKIQEPANV